MNLHELNVMLTHTLYFEPASIIAAVFCSLIVAGLLKGTIGVGMPVVALPLLSLFVDIKSAAMLLSMPLIFSNVPQALEGGKTGRCLMQLMPVFLGMIPGLFLGVRVLLALDANVAKIIAGLVLMGVGGVTLLAPKLQLQSRLVLPTGITFGFFGGILGGIAAMPGPLAFIFLLAKGLRGKAFTKEASLYLVVSAGLLAILLTASRQFSWLDVSVSTAACCQSWSACTSDNICAIKLHLRLGICRTLPKARKQSDGEGHSRRYCHVRSLARYTQHPTLPRPTETRLLVVFLRPMCKQ